MSKRIQSPASIALIPMIALVAWTTLAASPAAQPTGSGTKKIAARTVVRTTTTCLRCHGMPDPAVGGDALWISRIATTRCVAEPAPASTPLRDALQRYMRGPKTLRPTRVDAAAANAGSVAVSTNIVRGSILLEPFDPTRESPGRGIPDTIDRSPRAQPKSYRLVWTGKPDEDRARSIPPGRYRIRLYRLLRTDKTGKLWQIWGSGGEGQRLTAETGKPLHIKISHTPKIAPCASQKIDPLTLAGLAHGDHGMGITIMDGDKRTRATYRLIGKDGAVVAKGTLEYG